MNDRYTDFWEVYQYQASGIETWQNQLPNRGSTTLCGSELGVWFAQPYRSPKN